MFYWWAMDLESGGGATEADAAETPESIRRKFVFRGGQFVKAAGEESKSSPPTEHPADRVWEGAIAYWTLLAGHESFWSHWRQAQKDSCGCALQETDVEVLKEKIIDEHLAKTIQDFASKYQGEKKDEDTARHDRYLTAMALERKSAELWTQAGSLMRQLLEQSPNLADLPLLHLPGGYLLYERLGLLPDIYQRVEALSHRFDDEPLIPQLLIYFSPAGYGRIAALIEDRKKPREAMELLERLAEEHRERPEFIYLNCQAQLEQGNLLLNKDSLQAAMAVWEGAWNTLKKTLRSGGLASSFKKLLQSTRDAIGDAVFHACQKEAGKLKAQEKFEEAIAVLQMGFELTKRNDVKELLCIFYCDRGDRLLNDKKFKEARKDFESALAADPENARAKKSFGQTYVVEGLEYGPDNLEKAIEMFEKAMKHMGEDSTAGELMAQACNARAVEILNNMNQYTSMSSFDESIRLLRRAIKLLNSKIKEETLDTMVNHESVDAIEEATKDMKDDTYKKALQNLALAGRFKRQKRAGELNSQAVSILNSLTAYSSRWEVDRAIEMLEEAARIVGPQNAGTILSNLQTAYNLRRQLRGW
jgi:tetratricopeptide (TPR) repeat protein